MAREIQLTDWSTAGNRSNRSSGVQIPCDICTRFGRYLYSTKCSWIIMRFTEDTLRCSLGNSSNSGSSITCDTGDHKAYIFYQANPYNKTTSSFMFNFLETCI